MGLGDTVMPEREDDRVPAETKGAIFSDTLLMSVIIGRAAKDRK